MRPRRLTPSIVALLATLLTAASLSLAAVTGARGAPVATSDAPAGSRPFEIPAPPLAALPYRRAITTTAYRTFGLNAPVAVLAAQLHQESSWNPNARSYVGALGLAQFMPATARDMAVRYPGDCAPYNPLDPDWAIRCQQRYMRQLLDGLKARPGFPSFAPCAAWAMGLSAYNGGAGWVERDRTVAQAMGRDPNQWFGHVADTPDQRRARRFVAENRGYPQRILLVLQPRYVKHWNLRGVVCRV